MHVNDYLAGTFPLLGRISSGGGGEGEWVVMVVVFAFKQALTIKALPTHQIKPSLKFNFHYNNYSITLLFTGYQDRGSLLEGG